MFIFLVIRQLSCFPFQASRFRLPALSLSLSSRHLLAPSGGWGWIFFLRIAEVRSRKIVDSFDVPIVAEVKSGTNHDMNL